MTKSYCCVSLVLTLFVNTCTHYCIAKDIHVLCISDNIAHVHDFVGESCNDNCCGMF